MCSPFLAAPLGWQYPKSTEFQWEPSKMQSKSKVSLWESGATDSTKRSCCWNQNLLKCRKKAVGFYETLMTKEPYPIISYSCSFPLFANHLCWKGWHGRKWKERAAHSSPSSPSLLISKLKSEMLVECSHVRSQIKAVEFILFNVSIVLVRTKYICMYNLWNTNCVILVTLQMN